MPAAPPPQTTSPDTLVWIPHGELFFCAIIIMMWVFTALWIRYFKTLDHDVYCWLCGGDKKKNLCFMGMHHFTKDDEDHWHDHLAT